MGHLYHGYVKYPEGTCFKWMKQPTIITTWCCLQCHIFSITFPLLTISSSQLSEPVFFTQSGSPRCATPGAQGVVRPGDAWTHGKAWMGPKFVHFAIAFSWDIYIYIIIYIQVVYGRYIEVVYMYLAELTLVHGRYNLYFELLHRLYKPWSCSEMDDLGVPPAIRKPPLVNSHSENPPVANQSCSEGNPWIFISTLW